MAGALTRPEFARAPFRALCSGSLRRLLHIALVAGLVFATTGLPAAAAAVGVDECGDDCADDEDAGCPGDLGGEGCPPLCTTCVCASFFAPALAGAAPVTIVADVRVPAAEAPSTLPPSAPPDGVFHPPRLAA